MQNQGVASPLLSLCYTIIFSLSSRLFSSAHYYSYLKNPSWDHLLYPLLQLAPCCFAIFSRNFPRKSCISLLPPILFSHALLNPLELDLSLPHSTKPVFVKVTNDFHLLNPMTYQHYLILKIFSSFLDTIVSWVCSKLISYPFAVSFECFSSLTSEHRGSQGSLLKSLLLSVYNYYLLSSSRLVALNTTYAYDCHISMAISVLSPESRHSCIQTSSSVSLLGCQLCILNVRG